ncbi:MAG TPA: hypothetical protein VFX30_00500 [bacterium]|nr:hypothetical protein [bacterium]
MPPNVIVTGAHTALGGLFLREAVAGGYRVLCGDSPEAAPDVPCRYVSVSLSDADSVRAFRDEADLFLGRESGANLVLALGEAGQDFFYEPRLDDLERLASVFSDRLLHPDSRFVTPDPHFPLTLPPGSTGVVITRALLDHPRVSSRYLAGLLTSAWEAVYRGEESLRQGLAASGELPVLNSGGLPPWEDWELSVSASLERDPASRARIRGLLCGLRLLIDPAELAVIVLRHLESGRTGSIGRPMWEEYPYFEEVIIRRLMSDLGLFPFLQEPARIPWLA